MVSISVNNQIFLIKSTLNLIEACKYIGVVLPRFCYHEKLSIAANCRMCLVEISGVSKPITACSHTIVSNLNVFTNTPFIKKARENILEILLLNHPLDCPICDQGGECDLQDQVKTFGSFYSRFYLSNKRKVKNKKCSPLIKTIMTRCIHCTRCVRFGSEVAGIELLGTLNRGVSTEIGGYFSKLLKSEVSGNVIDLCPVGALTARTYHFNIRSWELKTIRSVDTLDSLGASVYFQVKESKIVRVLPKINIDINENWISDKTRFSTDSLNSKNRIKNISLVNTYPSQTQYNLNSKNVELGIYNRMLNTLRFNSNEDCVDLPAITFLIDENVDFEVLFLLQNLKKLNRNINVYSVDNQNFGNFDLMWKFDKIQFFQEEIKNCFLFTSNIRVENALLHLRLYVKSLNRNFSVFQFSLPSKSNFLASVINLNFQTTFNFFEGKEFFSSNRMLNKTSLFFFGFSFFNRYSSFFLNFLSFLKKNFPNSIVLKIEGKSNSASFPFLNVLPYNSKKIFQSNTFFLNHLENLNYKTKSLLKNSLNPVFEKKLNFWFHSHLNPNLNFKKLTSYALPSTFFNSDSTYVLPGLTSLESENIYLNLESRPQITQIVRKPNHESITLKFLLSEVFLKSKGYLIQNLISNKSNFKTSLFVKQVNLVPEFYFIFELIKNSNLFNSIKKDYSSLIFSFLEFLPVYQKFNKYPLKSVGENFHTNSTFLYNSINMQNYQNKINKIFDNFS